MAPRLWARYADGAVRVYLDIEGGEVVAVEALNTTGPDLTVTYGRHRVTLAGVNPRLVIPPARRPAVTVDQARNRLDGLAGCP